MECTKEQRCNKDLPIQSKFNKDDYKTELTIAALKVFNQDLEKVRKEIKEYMFIRKHFKTILPFQSEDNYQQHKLILLNPQLSCGATSEQERQQRWPAALNQIIAEHKCEVLAQKVVLDFDSLTYNEILEKIIPPEVGIPTGYEIVGKLAHFNLRPSQYPYKYIVGEVLLAKNKKIQTVVNKLQKLHNVFRTPELEYIAGVKSCETSLNEGKCIFHLDFSTVYWSSRNSTDRDRILSFMKPKQTVLDLFCGIGPLSVRAGKMGCYVIANDLNPECYKYLLKNVEANKVKDNVMCFNEDAKNMVRRVLINSKVKKTISSQQPSSAASLKKKKSMQQQKESVQEEEKAIIQQDVEEEEFSKNYQHFDHVYMNLPVLAIDFLFIFRGLLKVGKPDLWNEQNLPLIHVFGFVKGDTDEICCQLVTERIKQQLPNFKKEDIVSFAHVKNVTVKKREYCISFKLNRLDANLDVMLDNPELQKRIDEMDNSDNEADIMETEQQDEGDQDSDNPGDEIKKKIKTNN